MTQAEEVSNTPPAFFELLDESDRAAYLSLRQELASSDTKFKRYKRITSLQDALCAIRNFCARNKDDDWKRYLVCGVCWMGWDIAINTRQLRLLVNKCKSSINGALAKMGYSTAPIKGESSAALVQAIPFLKGNFVEQRMWTVRRRQLASPAPVMNFGLVSPFPASINALPAISPQPYISALPSLLPPACHSEITAVFGIADSPSDISSPEYNMNSANKTNLAGSTSNASGNGGDGNMMISPAPLNCCQQKEVLFEKKIDMFQDVCCCCPLDWLTDDDDEKDPEFLAYG